MFYSGKLLLFYYGLVVFSALDFSFVALETSRSFPGHCANWRLTSSCGKRIVENVINTILRKAAIEKMACRRHVDFATDGPNGRRKKKKKKTAPRRGATAGGETILQRCPFGERRAPRVGRTEERSPKLGRTSAMRECVGTAQTMRRESHNARVVLIWYSSQTARGRDERKRWRRQRPSPVLDRDRDALTEDTTKIAIIIIISNGQRYR